MKYELCHCAVLRIHNTLLKIQVVPACIAVEDCHPAQNPSLDNKGPLRLPIALGRWIDDAGP